MGLLEQITHLLNFLAPAWWLALFCALIARVLVRWGLPRARWGLAAQLLVAGLSGSAVLLGGLMILGSDGKMTTYGVLVTVCASVQWLACRGWRR
jgi:hypothetical protein